MFPTDIETFRIRVGLDAGDSSQDAQIETAKVTAITLMETYCDRKFNYVADWTEEFTHFFGVKLPLNRYPVETITTITGDTNSITQQHVNKSNGVLHFDGAIGAHILTITYAGGYTDEAWPDDLTMAFWSVFDSVWNNQNSNGGAMPLGEIKSVKAGDLSISYETGSSSQDTQGAFGGLVPYLATSILDLYKRKFV